MAARRRALGLAAVICSLLVAAPAVAAMRTATPDVGTASRLPAGLVGHHGVHVRRERGPAGRHGVRGGLLPR